MNNNDTNREFWEDIQVRPKEKTIRERFREQAQKALDEPKESSILEFADGTTKPKSRKIVEDIFAVEKYSLPEGVRETILTEGTFSYIPHFDKEKDSRHTVGKINVLLAEIQKLTEEGRLIKGQREMFLKLVEEVGEYSSAKLGDKPVKESCRQELTDVIITAISLFFLEGGNLNFLADYGILKLEKARKKIFPDQV